MLAVVRSEQEFRTALAVPPGPAVYGERELVAALTSGDAYQATRAYRQLRPMIDRALYRVFGGTENDHEDFVQATFEQLVDSLMAGRFQFRCSVATWAATIASRIALAELRRRYRFRPLIKALTAFPEPAVELQASLEARSELRALRVAWGKLPATRAEVLFLSDVEENSLNEVASALGISEEAAHARLVRGRRQLSELLERAKLRERP